LAIDTICCENRCENSCENTLLLSSTVLPTSLVPTYQPSYQPDTTTPSLISTQPSYTRWMRLLDQESKGYLTKGDIISALSLDRRTGQSHWPVLGNGESFS